MTATSSGPSPRTLTVDGCALSYLRAGSGPPLLYLHGSNGVAAWQPWMERLAGSFDLIVPDHPGWGRSPLPDWLDDVHDLAYFYLDVLRELNLSGVNLVGHSLGGWIAAELAVRASAPLANLTLIAPAGLRAQGVTPFDIFIGTPEASTRAAYYDQKLVDALLAQPPTDEQTDLMLRNRFATARVAWQPRLFDPNLHKWLHRVDVPTHLVWGANDGILPVALAKEWTTRIAGVRETILPACGHVPMIEASDAALSAIESFLKGTR
jgi:pimeloyl-ACP methyl ester carboxylesterase